MTKRTFIAIKISPNKLLLNIYSKIKANFTKNKIKWVNTDNFHITLKFNGETTLEQIKEINSAMENLCEEFSIFDISVKKFGVFPNTKTPKVFWFGLENNTILNKIQKKIDNELTLLGFEPEKRDFNPHLTIARANFIQNKNKITTIIHDYEDIFIQNSVIDEIIFYESILDKKGAKYIPIKIYKLNK